MFAQNDLVYAFTVDDGIREGVLVDVSAEAHESGCKYGFVLTRQVFGNCVEWTEEDAQNTGEIQDQRGRLHDVIEMALSHIRQMKIRNREPKIIHFLLFRIPRSTNEHERMVRLELVIEAGDGGLPYIVVRHPSED